MTFLLIDIGVGHIKKDNPAVKYNKRCNQRASKQYDFRKTCHFFVAARLRSYGFYAWLSLRERDMSHV